MNAMAARAPLISDESAHELLTLLKDRKILELPETEAFVHALVDIAESMSKIYEVLVPTLLSEPDAPPAILKGKLWDIREEFRHISYHISDARLTEL